MVASKIVLEPGYIYDQCSKIPVERLSTEALPFGRKVPKKHAYGAWYGVRNNDLTAKSLSTALNASLKW
jgi:hypothetical protein